MAPTGARARAHADTQVVCGSMTCLCGAPHCRRARPASATLLVRAAMRRWLGLRLGAPAWYVLAQRGCVCEEPSPSPRHPAG